MAKGLSLGLRLGFKSAAVAPGPAPADYFVSTDAEAAAAIAAASSGQIIEFADAGTFTALVNASGKTGLTLRGQTSGVPHLQAGATLAASTNCTLLDLKIERLAPNSTSLYSNSSVVEWGGATGCQVLYCEIASNPLASIVMQDGASGSTYFQGYRGIGGTATSFVARYNYIHDCYRGLSVIAGAGSTNYIEYNNTVDCYQNPCEMAGLAGSTIYYQHNDFIGTWAVSTDSGAPHSSVLGFGATAAWTAIVRGNILIAGVDRRFAAHGTYAAASGPKFNDTTLPTNGMHYTNCVFADNIVSAQDGIGLEVSLGSGWQIFNNTVVKDNVTASALTPGLNFHDIGAGSKCCRNVFPGMSVGTHASTVGGPNGVHSDWFNDSYDNITLRPNGLGGTVTGDLNCYDFHFTGPTFTGWTVENIVARLTPKVTSYLYTDSIGAVGGAYDWNARSYSGTPALTKPKTTNASGTTPALTQFDGTNDWLQMNVTAPFLDLSNRRELTMAFYFSVDAADTVDCYLTESSSTDFTLRRLPASSGNKIRLRNKNNAGTAICEIDSSGRGAGYPGGAGWRAADGAQFGLVTVNYTTGRYFVMCGKELDAFATVTTLKPDDYCNTRTAQAVMGQSDLTPPTGTGLVNGKLGLFYMTDEFIDLSVASNHDSVVATNGTPADWGADGSGLTGTQPRGFIKGNAAALNSGSGVNLGSSSDKWVMTGSVADV